MYIFSDHIGFLIGLLAVVDPVGIIPVFVSVTKGHTASQKRATARIAALTVGLTLLASVFVGKALLNLFGISMPAFQVAGGILLLSMSFSMLHAELSKFCYSPDEAEEATERESLGAVPLGIPLLSGPGAIALVIVQSEHISSVPQISFLCGSIVLVSVIIWLTLVMASSISRRIGRTGINISTRLMGLLLAAIAVEFIATGVRGLIG